MKKAERIKLKRLAEEQKEVMLRFNEGMRTDLIAKDLGMSIRKTQRLIRSVVGKRSGGKSVENALVHLRPVIVQLMQEEGRNFERCELCHETIPKGNFNLHHTKYDGCTYADLMIVCRACNTSGANKYLE